MEDETMSDQPFPPPPPASGPAPTPGIDKKTGAILSYVLWWITGIVFLFVGKDDPDVKYHAAQSVIFFGSVTALGVVISIINSVVGSVSLALILGVLDLAVWLFAIVIWIVCMAQAASRNGARFPLPLVGGVVTPYAEQLANAVK
jgi:uncharacterized membrane protein